MTDHKDLTSAVEKFWCVEEEPSLPNPKLIPKQLEAELIFTESTTRNFDGKFVIPLL